MASLDQLRHRFLDEVEHGASTVVQFDSAAVAEAWASGAIAEWHALEGTPGAISRHLKASTPFVSRLIGWADGAPMHVETGDPEWASDIGTHNVGTASRLIGVGSNREQAYILGCEAASGAAHDLSVTIAEGRLISITIGPEGLGEAAVEQDGVELESVTIDEVQRLIQDALARPLTSLSEASEANVPLLARRFGAGFDPSALVAVAPVDLPKRDRDEDAYAADVVAAAIRSAKPTTSNQEIERVRIAFDALVQNGDPDALTVLEVAGLSESWDGELESFERAVGAYLAPRTLAPHGPDEQFALAELEAADWIGVVLGLSRSAGGTMIDGDRLVEFINKTPEITTTIPKKDRARIAWAFEAMLYAWRVTGVLGDDGRVTDAAAGLLPRSALRVWSSDR